MRTFKSWTCHQSGDCCRTPPFIVMTDAEAKLMVARADRATRDLVFRPDTREGYVQMLAGPCPFLHGEATCAVYDVRPYNCRRFACLRGFRGTDTEAHAVRVLIQRKAQVWADAHGWSDAAG